MEVLICYKQVRVKYFWSLECVPKYHKVKLSVQFLEETYTYVIQNPLQVQATGFRVVVTVRFDSQACKSEERPMIAPRGRWQVHLLVTREEMFQEICTDAQRACA